MYINPYFLLLVFIFVIILVITKNYLKRTIKKLLKTIVQSMKSFFQFFTNKLTIGNLISITITFVSVLLFRWCLFNCFEYIPVKEGLELLDMAYLLLIVCFRFIINI